MYLTTLAFVSSRPADNIVLTRKDRSLVSAFLGRGNDKKTSTTTPSPSTTATASTVKSSTTPTLTAEQEV
ncbi:hypothetical protein SK128_001711 [Halocaridina rubra]|uniref:Uncharacterized protein n=1 Tax=Halocaridina rubra TaxID=373956 RepID=A0AAN8X742_HALRR